MTVSRRDWPLILAAGIGEILRQEARVPLTLPNEQSSARDARSLLLLLGGPTFGLAFAICILTTYGPVLLLELAGSPGTVGARLGPAPAQPEPAR